MVELGATSFRLSVPEMPREELRAYSTHLFDAWEERLGTEFAVREYSLRLEIKEGSVNGLAIVTAGIGALYTGIATYPKFIEGLQKIQAHVRLAADYLVVRAQEPFTRLNLKTRVSRRSGVPGMLQRLFYRVQRREIEVAEAMAEVKRLLGPDALSAPEFMKALATSLLQVRQNPEQLLLPMELPAETSPPMERSDSVRSQSPQEIAPRSLHLKVEVWRNCRTGKRQVRITEV